MQPRAEETPRPPEPGNLGALLKADHDRLETIFGDLLRACEADARDDLRRLWAELDSSLTAHMLLEERLIFPELAKVAPTEAASLLREHGELRRQLLELGVCVDLHAIRAEVGRDFIERLREHARREDHLLYRWATTHIDHEQATGLLAHLRAVLAPLRRSLRSS